MKSAAPANTDAHLGPGTAPASPAGRYEWDIARVSALRRLKLHAEVSIPAPQLQSKLKNASFKYRLCFLTTWLPPQSPAQVTTALVTALSSLEIFPLASVLSWCSQVPAKEHLDDSCLFGVTKPSPFLHSSTQKLQKSSCIYLYVYNQQGNSHKSSKVITATFLCATWVFVSFFSKTASDQQPYKTFCVSNSA